MSGGVTCEYLLGHLEGVDDGRGDACHGPDHTAQAQVDEHQEEHDGPERGGGEVCHGLSEGDEGQACALHGLRGQGGTWRGVGEGPCLPLGAPCFLLAVLGALGITLSPTRITPPPKFYGFQPVSLKLK